MGAPKQKWTSEEEEALRRGVLKHGAGKWRTIQKDPEFSPVLSSRSNIDLKIQYMDKLVDSSFPRLSKWEKLCIAGPVVPLFFQRVLLVACCKFLRNLQHLFFPKQHLCSTIVHALCVSSFHKSTTGTKDKWRNLSFSASGLGSRDKIRVPKIKGPSSSPSPSSQALLLPAPNKVAEALPPSDSEKSPQSQDGKTPKYSFMILEALSELKDPNGSDVAAICNFIEQRHEVQPNFRRLLGAKLRRLMGAKKIEKIDKAYRLTDSYATKAFAPMKTPKQKDPAKPLKVKASQNLGLLSAVSPALDAAAAAAVKVADAEAKANLANEHMIEAERILKVAEQTESLLTLATEIYERCSRGEVLTILQVAQREF